MIKQNRHTYSSIFVILVIATLLLTVGIKFTPSSKLDTGLPSRTEAPPAATYQPRMEPQVVRPPSKPIPAQIVVRFTPNTTQKERAAYVESISGTVVQNIEALDTVVLTVPEKVVQEPLPESPVVEQSEPDYFVAALDDISPINDPRYAEQWALPAIGAPEAWAQLPADAASVTVAVIDSGICASHPDLAGRVIDGWDFLESDSVPQDDFGHGCAVSGVIAANMNDGIGIAGVAPNAQIMPLRVLNASGVGSYSDVAAAIVYAADNGAQVINLSLGGSNSSSTLENAVNYAVSKGVIVVAAAGNSGTEGALYPAAYPDVIAVGSVDPDLQHSSFSNYGPQIDIWAPGRDILTTKRDGGYGLVSGTSFAAPYVAGVESIQIALGQPYALNGNILSFDRRGQQTATPTGTETLLMPTPTPTVSESTSQPPDHKGINYVPGEIILKLKKDVTVSPSELTSSSQSLNSQLLGLEVSEFKPLYFSPEPQGLETNPVLDRYYKITVPSDTDIPTLAEKIMSSPDVEFAVPNYIAYIDRVPNDPNFSDQWALTKINAPGAWDITTGSSNIVVAVLDTGFDVTHPDLGSKNNYQGYDFVNNDFGIQDDEGHGTAVSGIIAAKTNNGQGVAGVSWGAMIMPVKVCGNSGCPSDAIMNGIRWAADHGANVINMSLGGGSSGFGQLLWQDAIDYAYNKNITIVVSAGNNYEFLDPSDTTYYAPSELNHVIVVGAVNSSDVDCRPGILGNADNCGWPFNPGYNAGTGHGPALDVMAAGSSDIWTTQLGGGYLHNFAGTSSAAPFVSGVSALMLSKNSNLTPDQIESIIKQNAFPLDRYAEGHPNWSFGWGRLNAYQAVSAINVNCATLTLNVQGSGSASASPTNSSGCNYHQYTPGTVINLSASPDSGWSFANWIGTSGGSNINYTIQGNVTITAVFSQNQTNDNTPPTASWTSPGNGSTINSSTVTLSANASDTGGSGVREVRWSAKWNNQWFGVGNDSSSPYSIDWNLCNSGVPNGDVELGMEVWDNANNKWVYSEHYTNYHINKNYQCGGNDGNGDPLIGGPWTMDAWQNKYLAGYVNWHGTASTPNSPYIFFDWGTGAPFGWGGDEFSVRIWRNVYFPGGSYEFKIFHDDGVKLWVDGNLILDKWWDGREDSSAWKDLGTGDHEVKVEYYENMGDAALQIRWYGPGYPRPDNNPPDGRITSPTNNSASNADYLNISADAWDDASGVDHVDFYAWFCLGSCSWRLITSDYSAPYSVDNWGWSVLGDQHFWFAIDVYDKTGKVRYDAGGRVEVDLDHVKPTASINSPSANSYLSTNQVTVNVSANDDRSGVQKVQFFAGYNETAGAGAQGEIAPPIPGLLEDVQGEASDVAAQDYWHEIGWDENGSDGWNFTWDAAPAPDQGGAAFFIYAYDKAGNYQGAQVWPVMLDRVTPSSAINVLPIYTGSTSFTVNWTGADATSGINNYDIQYQDNGGSWTSWLSGTTLNASTFTGAIGHTYAFQSRAHDRAGNMEGWPASADTQTTLVTTPSNNNFGSALAVSTVPYSHSVDTRGATAAANDPTPTCGYGKNSNSVWYRYTASSNGLLEIDTEGSNYDTVLAVWTGTSGNLSQVACNDDAYGYLTAWLEDIPVTTGITYYIEVMDYGAPGGGNLELYVDFARSVSNNDFDSPVTISTNPANLALNTGGATKAFDDPELTACNRLPGEASVWYRYTPSSDGELQLDTRGSDYDTMLAIWTGTRGNLVPIGCNDDVGDVNGEWDSDSILNVQVTAGVTYYIEVSTFAGRIDVNGASALEMENKPDALNSISAGSLQERKTEIDKSGGFVADLQESRDDLLAQFWGGQLKLNSVFVPVPLPAGLYDDNRDVWTYSNGWTTYTNSGAVNTTMHRTSVNGSTATFVFQAPAFFTFYYRTGTNRGPFEIWVDGALLKTINAYGASTAWKKKYTSPAYTGGDSHTVVIKNIAPDGTYIDVDAMEITPAPEPSGPGIYDDRLDTLWVYSPGWTAVAPGGAYGGTSHRTSVKGSTATFVFQAPAQFVFTYRKCVSCGTFTIWVDGVKIATLDAYSTTTKWQKTYLSPPYPDDKVHTIVIKNASPTGTYIDVDAIEIISP